MQNASDNVSQRLDKRSGLKIVSFDQTSPQQLYIHWPFCKRKCTYCDFTAMEGHQDFYTRYHTALIKEIELFGKARKRENIETIFIGGGTPSLYPLTLLEELFETINRYFVLDQNAEVSLEVNPGNITHEHLKTWKRVGINRISLGVQVLDTDVLEKLNRGQSNEDVEAFMHMAPQYFENISADVIIGLPGVTDQTWEYTLERVSAWPIDHCSLYFLTVHEHTPLFYQVRDKKVRLPGEELLLRQYEHTVKFLQKQGYEQYEISNFSRNNRQSRHNQGYWERKRYKGFGLGAASFDGKTRTVNHRRLLTYCQMHESGSDITYYSGEKLSVYQHKLEELMLPLRTKSGVGLHRMIYLSDSLEKEAVLSAAKELSDRSLVVIENDQYIRLTEHGRLLENEVALRLAEALEQEPDGTTRD